MSSLEISPNSVIYSYNFTVTAAQSSANNPLQSSVNLPFNFGTTKILGYKIVSGAAPVGAFMALIVPATGNFPIMSLVSTSGGGFPSNGIITIYWINKVGKNLSPC